MSTLKKFDKGRIDFLGKAKFLVPVTLLLLVFGVFDIAIQGFNYGIDFAGGTEIQVKFQGDVKTDELRKIVNDLGYEKATLQKFGEENEFLIRLESVAGKTEKETNELLNAMIAKVTDGVNKSLGDKGAEIRRVDSVGPQVGEELKRNGILAALYSMILILIYIGLRFDYKYAPAAVICLFHDAILTLSVFSLTGKEVNVQTMAAILTLIGYSLNDTIITFDRVRENEKLYPDASFYEVVNRSINDMLTRTILTAGTTFIACAALYYFADGTIKDIAFTLGIGIIFGTYSSIYIASPLVIAYDRFEKRREATRRVQAARV